ncbi:hypothetical protein [Thermoanaerobacterium thermosaccharolyticum]|uniref:hypothetical protein n=1 Tax=Thermoanaerobacterium thermosaccharolyticum TaxID=1517 RepID=UPI0001B0DC06|nr:hypothetical protein [Thermoanaerobacterium thermosaccharolyticum]
MVILKTINLSKVYGKDENKVHALKDINIKYLADEPTGNLNTKTTGEVMNLIKSSIKKYNQTLVLITHNENIEQSADRILSIVDGEIR